MRKRKQYGPEKVHEAVAFYRLKGLLADDSSEVGVAFDSCIKQIKSDLKAIRKIEAADDAVVDKKCTDPAKGAWIQEFGFDFLNNLLSLESDQEVNWIVGQPEDASPFMNKERRTALLTDLQKHKDECLRCTAIDRSEIVFKKEFGRVMHLLPN